MPTTRQVLTACVAAVLGAVASAAAQEAAPPPPPEPPRVLVAAPLAVAPGTTRTVLIRGLKLAEATEVRFPEAKAAVTVNVKSKGQAGVPERAEAGAWGDTQVEAEVTVPPDAPAGPLAMVVVTPRGESAPFALQVVPALVEDKEPNGGFRQAQELAAGATAAGTIGEARDVDVYRVDGKAGQKIAAEVTAARLGGPLDGSLSLYDARGNVIATSDDTEAGRDPLLRATLPADGVYYLSVIDANDFGAPGNAYLMALRQE